MAGNFISNTISDIGRAINAPVIFDWDTNAARTDAATQDTDGNGNVKRNFTGVAGQAVANEQSAAQTAYDQALATAGGGGANTAASSAATTAARAAATAAAAKTNAARNNIITTQTGYKDAASQAALDAKNKYQNDVLGFLGQIEGGQDTINSGKTNNALNLRRSMSGIAGGIRTGLKSGGVTLANMNATDSGAADALARAYATLGNQQVGDANNEAALVDQDLTTQQVKLDRSKEEGVQGFDRTREAEVSRIKGDLRTKLALLDASGQAEGVNGVVNMGIVDAVINQAVQQLAEVDAVRAQRLGGVSALSQDAVNQKAAQMDAVGTEGSSPFTAGGEGVDLLSPTAVAGAPVSQTPFYTRKTDDLPAVNPLAVEDDKNKLLTV